MAAAKAIHCSDSVTFDQIIQDKTPHAVAMAMIPMRCSIRRQQAWAKLRDVVASECQYAKFTSNPPLMNRLLQTNDRTIVCANRHDSVWGIGYHLIDHADGGGHSRFVERLDKNARYFQTSDGYGVKWEHVTRRVTMNADTNLVIHDEEITEENRSHESNWRGDLPGRTPVNLRTRFFYFPGNGLGRAIMRARVRIKALPQTHTQATFPDIHTTDTSEHTSPTALVGPQQDQQDSWSDQESIDSNHTYAGQATPPTLLVPDTAGGNHQSCHSVTAAIWSAGWSAATTLFRRLAHGTLQPNTASPPPEFLAGGSFCPQQSTVQEILGADEPTDEDTIDEHNPWKQPLIATAVIESALTSDCETTRVIMARLDKETNDEHESVPGKPEPRYIYRRTIHALEEDGTIGDILDDHERSPDDGQLPPQGLHSRRYPDDDHIPMRPKTHERRQ